MKKLVDREGHVLSFHPLDTNSSGTPKIHRVGARLASTFLGFCAAHDNKLFAPIEQEPFLGNARQNTLIGYRALCHELYQKQAATDAQPALQKHVDRGLDELEQRRIQRFLAIQAAGRRAGLQELRDVKTRYDEALRTGDCTTIHSAILSFRGSPIVASTGSVYVDFDLQGQQMQNVAHDPAPIHGFNFGIVNSAEGCSFVATWPKQFSKCAEFVESLLRHNCNIIPSLLIEFCFAYIENTYFSAAWWDALPSKNKRHIEHLASIRIQYGNPLERSGLRHTDLELSEKVLSYG